MAVAPRRGKIDRRQVRQWYADWKRASNLPTFTTKFPDYLRQQIDALNLTEDQMWINTSAHDDLEDRTHIADMILMDLESYK